MTRDELIIARLLFKNKVLKSIGQNFEDLFTKIMKLSNSDFITVAAYGNVGDRKNDGYYPSMGHYYQVYAPKDVSKSINIAITKLNEDFDGLYKHWNGLKPIREFYFAINDRYNGIPQPLLPPLHNIENLYKITARPFGCMDLESVFLKLSESDIIEVVGGIPSSNGIINAEFSLFSDIIDHIMNTEELSTDSTLPDNPDFEKKIWYNKLSKCIASRLQTGRQSTFAIEEFFQTSNFLRSEVRDRIHNYYLNAIQDIQDCPEKPDLIFLYILDKICPSKKAAIRNAGTIIMSYYFEYCDIFETPVNKLFEC